MQFNLTPTFDMKGENRAVFFCYCNGSMASHISFDNGAAKFYFALFNDFLYKYKLSM